MYRSFEVDNFRCFNRLVVPNLNRINLIAGLNNVGKTAFLEALFLHCGAYNPALTIPVSALRGAGEARIDFSNWGDAPWNSIFRDFDTSRPVRLVGDNESTGRRTLTLTSSSRVGEVANLGKYFAETRDRLTSPLQQSGRVLLLEYEQAGTHGKHELIIDSKGIRVEPPAPPGPFPGFFVSDRMPSGSSEDAELFGKLEIENKQHALLRALRLIEPKLQRLAMVFVGGMPILHGDIGTNRLMPLPLMGGGMSRSLSVILRLCNASRGVILVDEIENGLHHSVMKGLWTTIGELAREFDAQVFATTHSLECITSAQQAFASRVERDFSLHRLERAKDSIRVVSYDQQALAAAIETGLETR